VSTGGKGGRWEFYFVCAPPLKKTIMSPHAFCIYHQTPELKLHRTPILLYFFGSIGYFIVCKNQYCVYLVDSARPNLSIRSSWRLRASCCEVGSSASPGNSETEAFRDWALEECSFICSTINYLNLDSRMGCWAVCLVPAGLFCYSCFNLCSLINRHKTWQNVNSKRRLQIIQNLQEGKRHQKKEISSCFVPSVFGEKFPTAQFWNYIGRNFLLGSRKKKTKCSMRTFTCRSTFLHGSIVQEQIVLA
jgi:hypothetical protein